MLIETVILAIIAGYLFKGNIKNMTLTPLKGVVFIFGGLLLRNFPVLFRLPFEKNVQDSMTAVAPVFFLMSFLMIAVGVWLNRKSWPMYIVLSGIILNFIVVFANSGLMPVSKDGLAFSGYDMSKIKSNRLDLNHMLVDMNTKFTFLSDIIPVPKPYPLPAMLSVGDIIMSIGIFLFIVVQMKELEDKYRFRHVEIVVDS